jgi:hypothetical protein
MKNKPTPEKTANDWLSVIMDASKVTPDIVPPGYKTIAEISKETGKSDTQIRRHLRIATQQGKVLTAKFRINSGVKLYPIPHYKIA